MIRSFVHCWFCSTLHFKVEGPSGPIICPRSVLTMVITNLFTCDSPETFRPPLRNGHVVDPHKIPTRCLSPLEVASPHCSTQWFVQSIPATGNPCLVLRVSFLNLSLLKLLLILICSYVRFLFIVSVLMHTCILYVV